VHSENGTRIGCGVIEAVQYNDETQNLLSTNTMGLADYDVASLVTAYAVNDGIVCYYGSAIRLEPDLTSYLNADRIGTDCNYTNGCGVHIHNGTSCADIASQGGHLYNADVVPEDPWLYTMYQSTDEQGDAQFVGCVETGFEEPFADHPFIVHSDNGTRVSCGILSAMNDLGPPAAPPVRAPVMAPSSTSGAAQSFSTMSFLLAVVTTACIVIVA
jgi:hypothetical protein